MDSILTNTDENSQVQLHFYVNDTNSSCGKNWSMYKDRQSMKNTPNPFSPTQSSGTKLKKKL